MNKSSPHKVNRQKDQIDIAWVICDDEDHKITVKGARGTLEQVVAHLVPIVISQMQRPGEIQFYNRLLVDSFSPSVHQRLMQKNLIGWIETIDGQIRHNVPTKGKHFMTLLMDEISKICRPE
jgi:hypothetical protein